RGQAARQPGGGQAPPAARPQRGRRRRGAGHRARAFLFTGNASRSTRSGGAAGVLIAKGAMKMMTLAKTKIVAGTTAVALVLGIGGVMTVSRTLAKDAKSDASAPVQLALADAPSAEKETKPDAEAKKEKPKKGRR